MPDSKTPIADSLKKLERLPADEFSAGITAKDGDVGAVVEGQKDIGKPGGWTVSGTASWLKQKGWEAAAMLRWKKNTP